MAVPQWRRASRKPPRTGALPKDDGAVTSCAKRRLPRVRGVNTVARRHGVIRSGGLSSPLRAAPPVRVSAVRQVSSSPGATPLRHAVQPLWFRVADAVCSRVQPSGRAAQARPLIVSCGTPSIAGSRSAQVLGRYASKQTTGRWQGSPFRRFGSRLVAPATGLDLIKENPRAPRGEVPGPAAARLRTMRARDWGNWRRDEPASPCDCDLRFSFP